MGVELLYNSEVKTVELSSMDSCSTVGDGDRRDMVRKATPGQRGPWEALMSWGPEKMLIRCNKGSHHPAELASGLLVEHQENKKDTK